MFCPRRDLRFSHFQAKKPAVFIPQNSLFFKNKLPSVSRTRADNRLQKKADMEIRRAKHQNQEVIAFIFVYRL